MKSKLSKNSEVKFEAHENRQLWNKAIDLIENPIHKRSPICTIQGIRRGSQHGCMTSASNALTHIRRAMLRHDWALVRSILSNCFLQHHRNKRDIIIQIMFQLLLSSPASSKEIIRDFCRMYLGVESVNEVETFLKAISTFPDELPSGHIKFVGNCKLYVVAGDQYSRATAYTRAVKKLLESKVQNLNNCNKLSENVKTKRK